MSRAERLLADIDPAEYSFEYVCFRVTDYRPDVGPVVTIPGEAVRHDLQQFVEDIRLADLDAKDAGEPVHTVEDLTPMFNVSTKTIQRWRDQGLVSRKFVVEGQNASVSFAVASNGSCRETSQKSLAASDSVS